MPYSVAPDAQASFLFPIVAPAAGTHNFQFGLVQEYVKGIGPYTPNTLVTVGPPTNSSH